MRVLGVETSCDETAAAVVEDGRKVLSSVVASQVEDHARYGGVVPEIASRKHLENISWVVAGALSEAGLDLDDIEGVAVTRGPGLVGALLVGLSWAKAVAYARRLPLVGVNHIEAHVAALGIEHDIAYPALALVVSGGHTALYLQADARSFRRLGSTRDDAVGEAFDKVAKAAGLGYPGGPIIDRLSRGRSPRKPVFPVVRLDGGSLDFSFSGIKSAVVRHLGASGLPPLGPGEAPSEVLIDVLAAFQRAAVASLIDAFARAARDRWPRTLVVAGGVACNSLLREEALKLGGELGIPVCLPRFDLATDNAAMVAALGYHLLGAGRRDGLDLDADPDLAAGSDAQPAPAALGA